MSIGPRHSLITVAWINGTRRYLRVLELCPRFLNPRKYNVHAHKVDIIFVGQKNHGGVYVPDDRTLSSERCMRVLAQSFDGCSLLLICNRLVDPKIPSGNLQGKLHMGCVLLTVSL
jgi:hypothetical protein